MNDFVNVMQRFDRRQRIKNGAKWAFWFAVAFAVGYLSRG